MRELDLHCPPTRVDLPRALGVVAYGGSAAGADCVVPLAVLAGDAPVVQAWLAADAANIRSGRHGELHYRHDETFLFGHISLAEPAETPAGSASALEAISRAAYTALFEVLQQTGFRQLLRCWNYLPRINVDGGGLERYRQFNIGRQDAFITAQRAWLEGAPSACALGSAEGRLVVYFLAGRTPATPIENPRQISAYRYPQQYGPRAPTFSRASLLPTARGEVLFVSGTASIVGHESVHIGDVRAQTRETLRNIGILVEEANRRARHGQFAMRALQLKVFVRHAADQAAVAAELHGALGEDLQVCFLQADVCRAELLVEIEAFGFLDAETPC